MVAHHVLKVVEVAATACTRCCNGLILSNRWIKAALSVADEEDRAWRCGGISKGERQLGWRVPDAVGNESLLGLHGSIVNLLLAACRGSNGGPAFIPGVLSKADEQKQPLAGLCFIPSGCALS